MTAAIDTAIAVAQPQTFELAKFVVDNWLNILFGVIGAIGTVLTVISVRSSQRDKRSYKFLLDLAEKNIDKNITEAQLKEKKEEVDRAVAEIERLQAQIKKDIPIEARKAVLRDKLNSQYIELTSTYKNVRSVKDELAALGVSEEMPPDLMKEIEKEISPQYLLKEERENLKTYLTVFTTLSAIASAVLPWEISRVVASLCLFAGLIILISSLPKEMV